MADAPAKPGNPANPAAAPAKPNGTAGGLALVRGNGAGGGGPHDLAAEGNVLGAILLRGSAEVVARVRGIVVERDFVVTWHKQVFAALLKLADAGTPIDPLTVAAALKSARANAPPLGEIHALMAGVFTAENVEHYATIVRDCSLARDLIATLRAAVASSVRARDMESVVASLETAVGAARSRLSSQAIHAADIIAEWTRSALRPTHRVAGEWYSDALGRLLPVREFVRRPDETILSALDRCSEALELKPPVKRSARARIFLAAAPSAYYRVLDALPSQAGAIEVRSDADVVRTSLWRALHAHRSITPAAVSGTRYESIYTWCERSAVFGEWIQVPGYHVYATRLARLPSAPIHVALRWPFVAEAGMADVLERFSSAVAFGRYLVAHGIGQSARIELDRSTRVRVVELTDLADAEPADPTPAAQANPLDLRQARAVESPAEAEDDRIDAAVAVAPPEAVAPPGRSDACDPGPMPKADPVAPPGHPAPPGDVGSDPDDSVPF